MKEKLEQEEDFKELQSTIKELKNFHINIINNFSLILIKFNFRKNIKSIARRPNRGKDNPIAPVARLLITLLEFTKRR